MGTILPSLVSQRGQPLAAVSDLDVRWKSWDQDDCASYAPRAYRMMLAALFGAVLVAALPVQVESAACPSGDEVEQTLGLMLP